MQKRKQACTAAVIFTVLFYAAWSLTELWLVPLLKTYNDNQYVQVLLRDVLIKNLLWTLPAVLLIHHYADEMLIGCKELFSFHKACLKYLLLLIPLAGFVLVGTMLRHHTLTVSSSFHPSQLIDGLLVGISEETVFRGFFLNLTLKNADTDAKKALAFGLNGLMFLLIHFPIWIGQGMLLSVFTGFGFLTIIGLGLLFGYCMLRCRSLWPAVILHSAYDILVFLIA